jgi:hypothetical protein
MRRNPVESANFSTVRTHSKTGSMRGVEAVLPVIQFSMYYHGLFIK